MVNVDNLKRRAKIVSAIRRFFDERDFTEVTTAVRIAAPAPEPHIDCPPCGREFLRASPELQMKKLLAMGMDRIYQIGPCFREGELGSRHNPEFTMIEWYRRKAGYMDIAEDLKALMTRLFAVRSEELGVRSEGGFVSEFSTITVREAYLKFAGWDPWAEWDQDRFDFDMATKIEPNLPKTPVFLIDYPPQASSLAKISVRSQPQPSTSTYRIAERWEFYWQGMELANCFTELCDEAEQRGRFAAAKAERQELGESDYPIDEEFLSLLPEIGSASGVALGVDRLVALLCGASDIHAVMA